jgi:hypothetical protein
VVDPKRLTHIHSHRDLNSLSLSTESTCLLVHIPRICLRAVPHAHWSPHVTTSNCSGITSLRSNPTARSSEELTIISTGSWEASVSSDGSHSSKVRPETSSSTRCSHTSDTRGESPFPKRTPFYSSYLWVPTLNSFSTQLMVLGTFPNFSSQECPGHTCMYSFGDQSS